MNAMNKQFGIVHQQDCTFINKAY